MIGFIVTIVGYMLFTLAGLCFGYWLSMRLDSAGSQADLLPENWQTIVEENTSE